jgi:hypothetical protein
MKRYRLFDVLASTSRRPFIRIHFIVVARTTNQVGCSLLHCLKSPIAHLGILLHVLHSSHHSKELRKVNHATAVGIDPIDHVLQLGLCRF